MAGPANVPLARVLFVGDVVGPVGLATVEALLPRLREERELDFCVANGENALPSGAGIGRAQAARLFDAGVDVITTGNHAFDAADADALFASGRPVVRPQRLAGTRPGRAHVVVERDGIRLAVVNVIGSGDGDVAAAGSPLADAAAAVDALTGAADLVLVDVHASWPAEKLGVAWTLDGRVCAVLGTHTHVPTADAQVLPGGTAYMSDVGMTGASDALIGFRADEMLRQARHGAPRLPAPVTSGDGVLMGALITATIDGRSVAIEPVTARVPAPRDRATTREPRGAGVRPTRPPAAAIFDCDGLLVDSAACWHLAYERVLAAQGRALDEALVVQLNGASVAGAADALGVGAAALHDALAETFARYPLAACPGARALLEHLHGQVPVAVATNAPRVLAELALRRAGLDEHVPVVVSADGGPGKPAPEVYLAACRRLGVAPADAIALEDSPAGATAAQAAGLRLVYLPSGAPGAIAPDVAARRLDDDQVLAALGVAPVRVRA
jgi:2',3'-cyclic-nucleotide 2'-phosphodiesterase